jgi:hypothetical protein
MQGLRVCDAFLVSIMLDVVLVMHDNGGQDITQGVQIIQTNLFFRDAISYT